MIVALATSARKHKAPRDVVWIAACIIALAVVVGHFTIVQLANMPPNPVSVALRAPIQRYLNPYFSQGWNFFAPTPLTRDLWLVARGGAADGHGGIRWTPLLNVSWRFNEKVRNDRLTPYSTIQLMFSNAVLSYWNVVNADRRARLQIGERTVLRAVLPRAVDAVDLDVLERGAAGVLAVAYPGRRFDEIQIGVAQREFPRFSRRLTSSKSAPVTLTMTARTRMPDTEPLIHPGAPW